jgi:hypothetical protein
MGTLGYAAIYNFGKNTEYPEGRLLGPVCWGRMAEGNNGVYFHTCRHFSRCTDLPADFRTIDKLRDWLPIRREQCGKDDSEEQMVAIIREADRDPVAAVAKRHGISEQTIYT